MSTLFQSYFKSHKYIPSYRDPTFKGSSEEYTALMQNSTTLYVGGLSETVLEERVWELFQSIGRIKRVVMGVNRLSRVPCGFCFVEFVARRDAEDAVLVFNGFRLDGKYLKIDIDYGYCVGREYGRKAKKRQFDRYVKRQRYF